MHDPDAGSPAQSPLGFMLDVGGDKTICDGDSVRIGPAPMPGYQYKWTPSIGLSDRNSAQPSASPHQSTRYLITATTPDGRTGVGFLWVHVNARPVALAGANTYVYPGLSTTLGAPAVPGLRYQWSPAAGLDDATIAQPHASPAASTWYWLTVTDANGCTSLSGTQVDLLDVLVANAGPSVGICAGDSVAIGGSATGGAAPYSYQWLSDVGCDAPGCIDDATAASPTVSPAQTTTFTQWVQDSFGIQANASTVVTVSPTPEGSAGADAYVDPGASASLGSTAVAGTSYAWTCDRPECALSATDQAQPFAAPSLSTQYSLAASTGPGCERDTSAIVWVQLQEQSAPLDGAASFPVSSKLQVQFDHPALASSVNTTNVELDDAVSGAQIPVTLAYDASTRVLSVIPPAAGTNGYSAGNDYTLTLHGDLAGLISDDPVRPNIFFGDVNIDFTTGGVDTSAPTVIYRAPAPGSVNVAYNTSVQAAFSEPLDPATVNAQTFQLLVNSQPIAGTVTYDFGSATAMFTPNAPLPVSSTFTVVIAGVKDLSGNSGSDTWTFSTGTTADDVAPFVTAVSPVDGSTAVLSNSTVSVTFSEPVNPATLAGFKVKNTTTGAVLGGTVAYDSATQTATFTPAALLDGSTAFQVNVAGVQDLAGNILSPAFSSSFRTMRTLFFDDFESGTAQWSLPPDAAGDSWGLTAKTFKSARHSLTDTPTGKYAANQTSTAQVLDPIDITGANQFTLLLALRTRLGGHNGNGLFYVDYAIDGGPWTQIGNGWTYNVAWTKLTLPVTVSSGSQLSLRLRLQSGTKKFDGVYVDDVMVQAP